MNRVYKVVFAIALALGSNACFACSCIKSSIQEQYSNAKDVFLGKVVETKLIIKNQTFDDQKILDGVDDKVRAILRVSNTFKGKNNAKVRSVLDSVADGANCGLGLLTGREYLIFLSGDDEPISICGGSRLYNEFSDKNLIDQMLSN